MQVRIEKTTLLETLNKNRAAHRAIFEEAVEGYRTQALALLDRHIADIKANKLIRVHVVIPAPVDQTKEYDRVIEMVKMNTFEHMDLDEHEFAQFVMDNWEWKHNFLLSNSTYSRTAMAAISG